MAGIGFVLRELNRRDTLLGAVSSTGHGAIVAAGPWIFCVLSIALIHRGTATTISSEMSFDFRGLLIYAFAISLLSTVPVVNVSIRMVADDIYLGEFENIRPRYLAALLASAIASGLVALAVLGGYFRLEMLDLVVAVTSTMVVGLIWPTLAFCGVIRDHKGIAIGFAVGLLMSIVGTIWAANHGWTAPLMMISFMAGLSAVFFWLAGRVLTAFSSPVVGLSRHMLDLVGGLRRHWVLALGSFVAVTAIWIDKWVMWFGPQGVALPNGLVSAPTYDGAMFIAYLVIIPALGLFVTTIETGFFDGSRRFMAAIQERGPLVRIERLADQMRKQTFMFIYRVLVTQATLCALAVLASPVIVPWVGLQFQQMGVLRLGILAALFQLMFLVCSSILLFFDRHVRFLLLQLLFLVAQVAFTVMTILLGPEYLGYGHLLACAVSGFASVVVLDMTLGKISYLTFAAALRQPARQQSAPARQEREPVYEPIELTEEEIRPRLFIGQSGPLLRP